MDKKIKEATDLVDMILVGDYSTYQALKEVDNILGEIENQIDTVPDQDIDQLYDDVVDELSKDTVNKSNEELKQDEDEVEHVVIAPTEAKEIVEEPPTIEESMKTAVKLLVTEETYREFFKSMLGKWNIKSPSDLDGDKKKQFFDAVDKAWKAKKETD